LEVFENLASSPIEVKDELVFVVKIHVLNSIFDESSNNGAQSLDKTLIYINRFELLSHPLSQEAP
jgi:hypothetical protein